MKTWNELPLMLTIEETMELLRIKRKQTVTDLCKQGKIPAIRANQWRIDRDGLRGQITGGQNDPETLDLIQNSLGLMAGRNRLDDELSQALQRAMNTVAKAWNIAHKR
ncbi:MAG TPA: DNA-binding protein [Marinobacter sp.]|uniref:Helix-turn-helix domain-containing protein n=1 Tax=marine sediment metagenome TaxID=412755 RepID=A0A0F9KVS8_9ZZZZ|nr:DNA-binding protein [Marinobacter sp.]